MEKFKSTGSDIDVKYTNSRSHSEQYIVAIGENVVSLLTSDWYLMTTKSNTVHSKYFIKIGNWHLGLRKSTYDP